MPKFSKRHYEAIAEVVKDFQGKIVPRPVLGNMQNEEKTHVLELIDSLVTMFESDNSEFKAERFREACE